MDSKKKNSLFKKKNINSNDETEEENILQECLNILEYLYKFRLIEKIARPIDKKAREEKISEYAEKLFDLHSKLSKIKN